MVGANLGRLAFDLQQKGHSVVGCEARIMHYVGAEFVRRRCAEVNSHRLQPFALNTCNRFKPKDHVRDTPIPDVAVPDGALPPIHFGEFIHLYDSPEERAAFDGLVTSFSVDTSPCIFRFVRTAAHVVRPGGIWTNFGPLAYDTDHDDAHGHGLELSWEELRYAVSHYFDIDQSSEAFVDSLNAANGESMMQTQYSCIFFKAVRNDKPAIGIGGTK